MKKKCLNCKYNNWGDCEVQRREVDNNDLCENFEFKTEMVLFVEVGSELFKKYEKMPKKAKKLFNKEIANLIKSKFNKDNICKTCNNFTIDNDKINGFCKVCKTNRIIENSCVNYENIKKSR